MPRRPEENERTMNRQLKSDLKLRFFQFPRFNNYVTYLLCALAASACTHMSKTGNAKEYEMKAPIMLEIGHELGQFDISHYRYHSSKSTYDARKIRVKRDEIVNFKVRTEVKGVTPMGMVKLQVKTLEKEGPVELNDLAYPEVNESIDFTLTKNAQVIRAGGYSSDSIFYVQPIPLPNRPVNKGDTWAVEHAWLSRHNGIPLKLELVAILSRFVECGPKDICADIEVSGQVTLPPGMIRGSLDSKVFGRMLFATKKGLIVWSEVRTEETLQTPEEKVEIASCMESVIETPSAYRWSTKEKPFCTPQSEFSNKLP